MHIFSLRSIRILFRGNDNSFILDRLICMVSERFDRSTPTLASEYLIFDTLREYKSLRTLVAVVKRCVEESAKTHII